jgi:hypothetical protein
LNSSLNSVGVVVGCDRSAIDMGILAPALPVSTIRTIAGSGVDCLHVTSRPPQVLITFGGLSKSRVLYRLLPPAALAEISSVGLMMGSGPSGVLKWQRADQLCTTNLRNGLDSIKCGYGPHLAKAPNAVPEGRERFRPGMFGRDHISCHYNWL